MLTSKRTWTYLVSCLLAFYCFQVTQCYSITVREFDDIIYSGYQTDLASNKKTRQNGDQADLIAKSGYAVDGNRDSCAFIDSGSYQTMAAWWQVDLADVYDVSSVVIVAPATIDYAYLTNFAVMVGVDYNIDSSTVCATFNDTNVKVRGVQISLNCTSSTSPSGMNMVHPIGRYVTIKSNEGPNVGLLSMCDVRVFGQLHTDVKEVAFNRPARQSEASQSYPDTWLSLGDYYDTSSKAVDFDPNTCTLAQSTVGDYAWWQVDLGKNYRVTSVDIVVNDIGAFKDAYKYLQNFIVMVKSDIGIETRSYYSDYYLGYTCYNFASEAQLSPSTHTAKISLTCANRGLTGRYVTIKRLGGNEPSKLALCDVKVNAECSGKQCDVAPEAPTDGGWVTTTQSPNYRYPCDGYWYNFERHFGLQPGDSAAIALGVILFVVLIYCVWLTNRHFGMCRNGACKKKTTVTMQKITNSTSKRALIDDTY